MARKKKVYDIDVVASGYEFTCPKCETNGRIPSIPALPFACEECGALMTVGNVGVARD